MLTRAEGLVIEKIPLTQGLYIFTDSDSQRTLYVGETSNLRKRLSKHLEHSDNQGLARWLWEHGTGDIWVEYHELPSSTSKNARKAFECELIHSRRPEFNVLGR